MIVVGIKAIILDKDTCYAHRLSEWMKNKNMDIVFELCETLEEAAGLADSPENTVLLLADCIEVSSQAALEICAAAHFTNALCEDRDDIPSIWKYQKGREIYEQIGRVIEQYQTSDAMQAKRRITGFEIFSVVSLVDYAGARTTAAALAERYRERGKNIFIWNLKPENSIRGYLENCVYSSPDELVTGEMKAENSLCSILEHTGQEQMTSRRVQEVMETVRQSACFDAMIMIVQCDSHEEYQPVYNASKKLIMVVKSVEEELTMRRMLSIQDSEREERCAVLHNTYMPGFADGRLGSDNRSIGNVQQCTGDARQVVQAFKDEIQFDALG